MKKSTIIGFTMIIVGIILTAVAGGHTGFKTIVWDNGLRVVDEQGQKMKMVTKQLNSFDQLNFKTGSKVVLQVGNVDRPTISYPKFNRVSQVNKTITVKGTPKHRVRVSGFSITSDNTDDGKITITLPKNSQLTRVNVRTDNSISVKGLVVDNFKLTGNADVDMTDVKVHSALDLVDTDDTTLKDVTAAEINQSSDGGDLNYQNADFSGGINKISTDGGDVTITATKLKDSRISTDGDDIDLMNNQVMGSLTAKSNGGDIDVQIPNRRHVQVSTDADGGDVSIFNHGRHSWQTNQSMLPAYHLVTDGGNISVR